MKFFLIIILEIILSTINHAQSNVIKDGNIYYFADRIIVKYKNIPTTLKKTSNPLSKFNIQSSRPTFQTSQNELSSPNELDKIYTLYFSSPFNPIYIAKEISKLNEIEWVEPHYLYEVTYQPNDPVYSDPDTLRHKHLDVIKAKEAWDLNTGSEDIIIAIVDTGVDWDHPDLSDNIWINSGETPNNGIDDDNNEYIDDVRGWDFGGLNGTPDNNPNEDNSDHGTHVAGLASASTDNGIGIASIGFNCKLMAVKTSRNDIRNENGNALISGYEGIVYAADNGAHVINCSWGNKSYSFASQSVINYAISKGALVVAAAGNANSSDNFYPASYDGVLSVGATDFSDRKASWSNYGTKIDVCSPGVDIYSTWFNNSYEELDGTSMASPITAGLAALVTSQFPNYSPLQIAEQIRVNTDNIDAQNSGFLNKIGTGRINAFKSLSNVNSKSVRITNMQFIDLGNGDGIFEAGENVKLDLEITNYLSPMPNLSISLSTSDNNIDIINSGETIGAMNTLEKLQVNSELFEFSIRPTSEDDVDVNILVSYSDAEYTDYEWITVSINPTYKIHTTENLSLTFNSAGSIGFDDYPTNLKGSGLIFKDGPNLMFEGALVYGTSARTIVNSARNEDGDKDSDFSVISPIILNSPGDFADKETYTKFNDVSASPQSLGIETEVYTYSFANEIDADYMFVKYVFNNTTNESIQNFYAGQYWDFDMDATSFDDDMVAYESENEIGYVFDNDGDPTSTHIGFSLLSEGNMGFFAMNSDGHVNPIISYDGFTDEEKWTALTSGITFPKSGPSDISLLVSSGPYTIEPNFNTTVDFVVAAGDNFNDLQNNILRAKDKYAELPTGIGENEKIVNSFELKQNYPNPFNPNTTITYSIPNMDLNIEQIYVTLKVYDVLGQEVDTIVNQHQASGSYKINFNGSNLPSGIYIYKLKTNSFSSVKKMILLK